jgi:hypothetical protein
VKILLVKQPSREGVATTVLPATNPRLVVCNPRVVNVPVAGLSWKRNKKDFMACLLNLSGTIVHWLGQPASL